MANSPSSSSPCIGMCKLDSKGICMGCGRDMKAIMKAYEDQQAQRINAAQKKP